MTIIKRRVWCIVHSLSSYSFICGTNQHLFIHY